MNEPWHRQGDNLYLNIHLIPCASRDAVIGPHNNALKIRVTSPAIDGRANEHLIKFLASEFRIAKFKICIVQGEKSKNKMLVTNEYVSKPTLRCTFPPHFEGGGTGWG